MSANNPLALRLSYNSPLDVPPEHFAWIETYDGSVGHLRITNLSASNSAEFWLNAGAFTHRGTLPANDPTPFTDQRDYGGVKLMITNLSPAPATLRIMLTGP